MDEQADKDRQALHELEDLDIITVGLVGKPANRKKFLLLKSLEGGGNMDEFTDNEEYIELEEVDFEEAVEKASTIDEIKTVLKSAFAPLLKSKSSGAEDTEDDTETDPLEKAEADIKKAARGALRMLSKVKGDPACKDVIASLAKLAGYPEPGKAQGGAYPEPEEKAEADVKKAAKAALRMLSKVKDEPSLKNVMAALAKLAGYPAVQKDEDDLRFEVLLKAQEETRVELEKAQRRAEEAERIAKEERDLRLKQEYLEKAQSYVALPAKTEELAEYLRWMDEADPKRAEYMAGLLKAADQAMVVSGIFDEFGSSQVSEEATPFEAKVKARTEEIRKSETDLSYEEAYAKAFKQMGSEDKVGAEHYILQRQREAGRR